MPNQGGHDTGKHGQKDMQKDMHPSKGHTQSSGTQSASGSPGQHNPQSAPGAGKDKDQHARK
ncbi:MAG: hypothetical protein KF735_14435 [Chelatococcus sp.]|uniref:hypothetical protein n=1 Tax=unclassified Chelatococcus TaxID=2638111 RepID=UPI001BCC7E00|nr:MULTISPECIES: hypothetical protein [unclassified Chelatococcus]CAH1666595.1 conserved hypothetical protein [Hyphomicrobiales bacterium]MBS7737874.1 hypothetical protein [Chelatococcus sp. HY11]MBX3538841.1 hypothetical protein [Chelatococcus sp.]MBX3546678.1 hypothetical protein [Chelatococcus sp.]MCO5079328.1 hypothetical protein [Chelatococcus sp.]